MSILAFDLIINGGLRLGRAKYANQALVKYNTLSRNLLSSIRVYKQTGEEMGQVEDLVRFLALNSTGTGKVHVPL